MLLLHADDRVLPEHSAQQEEQHRHHVEYLGYFLVQVDVIVDMGEHNEEHQVHRCQEDHCESVALQGRQVVEQEVPLLLQVLDEFLLVVLVDLVRLLALDVKFV